MPQSRLSDIGWWLFQAFNVAIGAVVLGQFHQQATALLHGADSNATKFFRNHSMWVNRLEHEDGSHQIAKYIDPKLGAPFYHLLHFLPAAIWAIVLPFQVTECARKRWPWMHRVCGRIFLACSLMLGLSSFMFLFFKTTFSEEEVYLWFLSIAFLVTGWLAYTNAAARRIQEHTVWITRHIGSGMVIYLMRAVYAIWFVCVFPDAASVPREILVPARKTMFGTAALISVAVCLIGTELLIRCGGLDVKRTKAA
jgi:hypothetical protein